MTTEDIFPNEQFDGVITLDDIDFPVVFNACACVNGRLVLAPLLVDKPCYFALAQARADVGQEEIEFRITAKSVSGKTFSSARASLRGHQCSGQGFLVTIAVQEATIEAPLDVPVAHPVLRRHFRGFSSYRGAQAHTPLGVVVAFGDARLVSSDTFSGGVQVSGKGADITSAWLAQATGLLDHMQCGLALAHGGRLMPALEVFVENDKATYTFFAGDGFRAELPVQPHLDLGPIVKALCERFFKKGPLADILWTALAWTQAETTIDELRFLTGMIAIEALADSYLPKANPSFAQRIEALVSQLGVAAVDFDSATIKSMVLLRNKIVHEGVAPNNVDLWVNIILVRELVTRILLGEIGFVGNYWCYLVGRHMRRFPECAKIES